MLKKEYKIKAPLSIFSIKNKKLFNFLIFNILNRFYFAIQGINVKNHALKSEKASHFVKPSLNYKYYKLSYYRHISFINDFFTIYKFNNSKKGKYIRL